MSRDHDIGFCRTESIGAPELVSPLNGWPALSPVNASLRPRGSPRMNSGSVRFATPSPQRAFTSYLLPVSRRTRPHHQGREALPDVDALGYLCSLRARLALDGVSAVQRLG